MQCVYTAVHRREQALRPPTCNRATAESSSAAASMARAVRASSYPSSAWTRASVSLSARRRATSCLARNTRHFTAMRVEAKCSALLCLSCCATRTTLRSRRLRTFFWTVTAARISTLPDHTHAAAVERAIPRTLPPRTTSPAPGGVHRPHPLAPRATPSRLHPFVASLYSRVPGLLPLLRLELLLLEAVPDGRLGLGTQLELLLPEERADRAPSSTTAASPAARYRCQTWRWEWLGRVGAGGVEAAGRWRAGWMIGRAARAKATSSHERRDPPDSALPRASSISSSRASCRFLSAPAAADSQVRGVVAVAPAQRKGRATACSQGQGGCAGVRPASSLRAARTVTYDELVF